MTDQQAPWTDEDHKMADLINGCVELIASWQERIRQQDDVEPGSLLAADDSPERIVQGAVRDSARFGIVTSVEHLGSAVRLLRAGEHFTFAPFQTLTRSALLAAAESIWVQASTPPINRRRALWVRQDERKHLRAFLMDLTKDPSFAASEDEKQKVNAAITEIGEELPRIRQKISELPKEADYTATSIIESAASLVAKLTGDHTATLSYMTQWRLGSAGAHARAWTFLIRDAEVTELPNGTVQRQVRGHLTESAHALGASTAMAQHAIELWERRRRA